MSEWSKTGILVAVAAVSCVWAFAIRPSAPTLAEFSDQGEQFYPNFTDPLKAAALEVIDYSEENGTATPFRVEVKDGVWSIPSHYYYPADGETRLASTAASIIDLRKDAVQSSRTQDHEMLGVIDPLDESVTTLKGRGQRVKLFDESGAVLADYIIGKPDDTRRGFRFVRLPDKKRTYSVKVSADISTRFVDWIESNLLKARAHEVREVLINNYSVDESTGRIDVVDAVELVKNSEDKWEMVKLPEGKVINEEQINAMTRAMSNIKIAGVRPKPESLTKDLRTQQGIQLDLAAKLSLTSKGFFISNEGQLLSNEGEVIFGTAQGIRYTLRFGEVLVGEGLDISAGSEQQPTTDDTVSGKDESEESQSPGGVAENRYLFVTAQYDQALLGDMPAQPEGYMPTSDIDAKLKELEAQQEQASQQAPEVPDSQPAAEVESPDVPAEPEQTESQRLAELRKAAEQYERDVKVWQDQRDAGQELANELNDRFAEWYYVMSGVDFKSMRPNRETLVMNPEEVKEPQLPEIPEQFKLPGQ